MSQSISIVQALQIALTHHQQGQLNEAENIYGQVLQAEPTNTDALHLLGLVKHARGQNAEAIGYIEKALQQNPDFAEANSNLGAIYRDEEDLEKAVYFCEKAIALNPNAVDAYTNLGASYADQKNYEKAILTYQQALKSSPRDPLLHFNLGLSCQQLTQIDAAYTAFRKACQLERGNQTYWYAYSETLRNPSLKQQPNEPDLLKLLDFPFVSPQNLFQHIVNALLQHKEFKKLFEETTLSPKLLFQQLKKLSKLTLFLKMLQLFPIYSKDLESALTDLRRQALHFIATEKISDHAALPVVLAIAQQSYLNDFVFTQTTEETKLLNQLETALNEQMETSKKLPPYWVTILACYKPISEYTWVSKLDLNLLPSLVRDFLSKQKDELESEAKILTAIEQLTPVQEGVSSAVRNMYEENPYPKWINPGYAIQSSTIKNALEAPPLELNLSTYLSPTEPDILVAGCGTGRHAIETAKRFANCNVLAIDLSLRSLAYAQSHCDRLGINNIRFAQADIMELKNQTHQFDLIESVGVLHHLSDPIAGWAILTDKLKANGLMKIGLYSRTARQAVNAGRKFIKERGYQPTSQGIRQCRTDLMHEANKGNELIEKLLGKRDFFSLSECRDLLFHVQEHQFTLKEVQSALEKLGLTFLGFELSDPQVIEKFRTINPNENAKNDLALWHQFEQEYPDTFAGMYQIWCHKS
ncbi:tetratricopeptide repeat protein [Terasakiella sp. A23]|uniref:tetratricopeptide repeat protein n=1 Tax=Terasakiella sp. FCG-A23 TaxID=3080561 RepID=UPI002953145A|nr:tetratricopeptide repeat protein [Terasakiella sp. A23]MDV7341413.1 tetratricopeptide repeat protein [Terasakiella sp. A23]